ncbi:glycosyl transferase family 2 [Motilibacter rhizosphaerae]|uniref:Glycosyl transferase family 2 n=1 Tax=Motilibacter rhizosphaerae TaxID=598652 RepID=A0A4Q7NB73_9ACTN|nr:glycosyltransferase [Motilibacter rhizosphaerae]RZS80070.1 glycosyl transferase family 2 [Motilibacter rhizosphaerae]
MPLVTVITPTRNRLAVLPRAVASVLGQTMPDLQLVVVDDGSSDGTAEFLDSVADSRLTVLRQEHSGVSVARNAGLAVAQGELVAYLDSDNTWSPEFLEVMTGELRETDVLAYCNRHLFLLDGPLDDARVVARKTHAPSYNPAALLRHNSIDTNVMLHRRSVIDEVGGFDEDLHRLVDWDLVVRIVLRHPFAVRHVDQVLCDYHYYRAAQLPSITNGHFSDAHLESLFGIGPRDPVDAQVLAKIEAVRAAGR